MAVNINSILNNRRVRILWYLHEPIQIGIIMLGVGGMDERMNIYHFGFEKAGIGISCGRDAWLKI